MRKRDIVQMIKTQFPDSHIDRITPASGKTIVNFTDGTGNQQIAEVWDYMGIPVLNHIIKGKES